MNYGLKNIIVNNMGIEGEQKYFTAKEARQISDEINNGNMKDELNWVYNLINDAMLNGKHSVMFSNKTLMKSTYEFLKSKGFNIDHFSGCQWDPADDTTISW